MYEVFTVILLVGLWNGVHSFNTPSNNLQLLPPIVPDVDLDFCPTCIDESVAVINILLNVILDEGILATCGELCAFVANKTGSKLAGDICDLTCDGVGIDDFIRLIITIDLDPIWYCELADLCPSKTKKKTRDFIYLNYFISSQRSW